MVHSFAKKKKKVKGKEGGSTCKLASSPVAKFIYQMQGVEPCTLASKMKGKQMISNQNQLHKNPEDPKMAKAVSAQASILCYPNLLGPNSTV